MWYGPMAETDKRNYEYIVSDHQISPKMDQNQLTYILICERVLRYPKFDKTTTVEFVDIF